MIVPIIIVVVVAAIAILIQERRRNINEGLQRHYMRSILLGEGEGERYLNQLSTLSSRRAKRVAAEVIAALSPIIYKIDEGQLTRISQALSLPQYLLLRAQKGSGGERARSVSLLSQIPPTNITIEQLKPLLKDRDRMVRFFAMIAAINVDNNNILHYIAAYSSPLTPFELSQLLGLLRRGTITIAYQPLLNSSSINLNMLGLAVIREFGIESAEGDLRQIIKSSAADSLRREALYTLAALQLSLCTPSIGSFVHRMPSVERRQFLRYITSEGYSQSAVDFFATHAEREYFHSLIDSYKVKIGCY